MPEPSFPSICKASRDGTEYRSSSPGEGWLQTRDGQRYVWEIGAIIVLKLALLVALWFLFIKPWSRPPPPPATVAQHLYSSSAPASRDD